MANGVRVSSGQPVAGKHAPRSAAGGRPCGSAEPVLPSQAAQSPLQPAADSPEKGFNRMVERAGNLGALEAGEAWGGQGALVCDDQGQLIRAADFIPSLSGDERALREARLAEAKARRRDALKAGKASMKTARKGVEARRSGAGRRAQPSAFALMATQGHLPPGLIEAGLDIDRIVGALEAGVMARSDTDSWATGGVKADGIRGAPQFMAVEGYLDRYLPWAKRLGEPDFRRGGQPGRVVLAVVIAVVCDGRSLRSLDQEAGVRRHTCMGLLCDGLREYCRIAGWREGG